MGKYNEKLFKGIYKNKMSKKLFIITEIIILIITFFISIEIIKTGDLLRFFLEMFCIIIFLIITELYKKKRFFDITYIYYLIVIIIDLNISSYYYTTEKILFEYKELHFFKDDYYIYYKIYMGISIIILIYLLICKKRTIPKNFKIKLGNEKVNFFIGSIVALPLALNFSEVGNIIFVPILNVFYMYFLLDKNKKKSKYLLYGIISIIAMSPYIYNRFRVLIFIFPLILTYILYLVLYDIYISNRKIIILIICGSILILLYGVISEIIKLNMFYGGNLKIEDIIFNLEKIFIFFKRQIFRIFGIWIMLSGNMISHVYNNGFFLGLSYIKSIAPYLGLPYINIPIISAKYIKASYAQIGLIMEGFVNFNILGAIIAGIFPFFLLDFLTKCFMKKKKIFNMCLITIPFTKVFLDGGSINSVFYNMLVCTFIFILINLITIRSKK